MFKAYTNPSECDKIDNSDKEHLKLLAVLIALAVVLLGGLS